jgi:N-methylhydantoinase A
VNCAFGLISADVAQDYSIALPLPIPAPTERVNTVIAPLWVEAERKLQQAGFSRDDMQFDWSFDLRYRRQVHQLTTAYSGAVPVDDASMARLTNDFEALYERRYGQGSAYRHAGIEITMIRLKAVGRLVRPPSEPEPIGDTDPSPALNGRRRIYSEIADAMIEAPIHDYERMRPGMILPGPTVIHTPITTVVVQGGQAARMDSYRNIVLESP